MRVLRGLVVIAIGIIPVEFLDGIAKPQLHSEFGRRAVHSILLGTLVCFALMASKRQVQSKK